jgi:hypothetical protein
MVVKKTKRSALSRAWSAFRKTIQGKADCVVVFQCFRNEDGTWEVDWASQHWLADVPHDRLPPGIPAAITTSLGSHAIARNIGGRAGPAAANFIQGIGQQIAGSVVDRIRGPR